MKECLIRRKNEDGEVEYWNAYDCVWSQYVADATKFSYAAAQGTAVRLDTTQPVEVIWKKSRKLATGLRQFGIGHLPVGTVVELYVEGSHHDPIQRTVTGLVCNGSDSWVLKTDQPSSIGGLTEAFNVSYVTGVVRRGTGSTALTPYFVGLDRDAFSPLGRVKAKGRNQYASYDMRTVVNYLISTMTTDAQLVDGDKLYGLLHDCGAIQPHPEGKWSRGVQLAWKANKKRLKRRIRQLLPKCLLNRELAQRQDAEAELKDYERDFDNRVDMEFDRPIEVGTTEGLNEHGNSQVFIHGEPVCAQCHLPYTNHGANHPYGRGTMCYSCRAGDYDDYDYKDYLDQEDRNLTLPPEFLTNFNLRDLLAYRAAVAASPIAGFEVRDTDCDGRDGMGSLWFFGTAPDNGLTDFWDLLKIKWQETQNTGGVKCD